MAYIASSVRDKIIMKGPPPKEEKYWNKSIETMPRKDLLEFQWRLLKKQIEYVYQKSRFYRKKLDEARVAPNDIKSIEDFRKKVPITSKDDIRADIEKSGDIFGGDSLHLLGRIVIFCAINWHYWATNANSSH